jgi:hypothetical protein
VQIEPLSWSDSIWLPPEPARFRRASEMAAISFVLQTGGSWSPPGAAELYQPEPELLDGSWTFPALDQDPPI